MQKRKTISDDYIALQQQAHEGRYGHRGFKHLPEVIRFAHILGAETILDYGAGKGSLGKALRITELYKEVVDYDPAILEFQAKPDKQFDLVVCTDVAEHIEPEYLDAFLTNLFEYSRLGCFMLISCEDTKVKLSDGRSAHLTVKSPKWWQGKLNDMTWRKLEYRDRCKELLVWAYRQK